MQEILVPEEMLNLIEKDDKYFLSEYLSQVHAVIGDSKDIELKIISRKVFQMCKDLVLNQEYTTKIVTEDIIMFFGAKTLVLDKKTDAHQISTSLYKVGEIMQTYFNTKGKENNE